MYIYVYTWYIQDGYTWISMYIPGISTPLDIPCISMNIHGYPRDIDKDGIYMGYTWNIPCIYMKSGFQMLALGFRVLARCGAGFSPALHRAPHPARGPILPGHRSHREGTGGPLCQCVRMMPVPVGSTHSSLPGPGRAFRRLRGLNRFIPCLSVISECVPGPAGTLPRPPGPGPSESGPQA
jgi:hypothetical protein